MLGDDAVLMLFVCSLVGSTARVLASQAEAIVRAGKTWHKLLNGGQATKWRN